MPGYFGVLTMVLMMGMVFTRVQMMKRRGIEAFHFGKLDKSDFLLPPFVLFYLYLIVANAFGLPTVSKQTFFGAEIIAWTGVVLCLAELVLFLGSLISFGQSFRLGIDTEKPDKLITTGVFSFSRNPIYVAFLCILLGQFLIFSNWILLVYFFGGFWVINRQIVREEAFLQEHYGEEYMAYCKKVRRYL